MHHAQLQLQALSEAVDASDSEDDSDDEDSSDGEDVILLDDAVPAAVRR